MRHLIVAALLAAGPAYGASMIAKSGENWLRISDAACTNAEILSNIKDEWKDKFKAGTARANDSDFAACWITQEEQVFVLFDDGDRIILPMTAFKPDSL